MRTICLSLLIFLSASASPARETPLNNAMAIWDMSAGTAGKLLQHGSVSTGVHLSGTDLEESLARGGDGYVARFRGGYLTTRPENPVELTGKHASIYMRVRDASRKWDSVLLATAHSEDPLANLIYGNQNELTYRWRTTPPWYRVEGIQPYTDTEWEQLIQEQVPQGSYGFNGQYNDAHDALAYYAGKWNCSAVRVHDDGKVIVSDPNHRIEKHIDIARQNTSDDAFFVGSKSGQSEFLNGNVAEIVVYDRTLTDEETKDAQDYLQAKWNLASVKTPQRASLPENPALHLDASNIQLAENEKITGLCI